MPSSEKVVYLTFDDGPHPTITPWVLGELRRFNAEATFFCLGNNVSKYPETYRHISAEGHSIGNHTFQHLNGWKTKTEIYLNDVAAAAQVINSNLFRPPYGKITSVQANRTAKAMGVNNLKIIMWDVLSADFDTGISPGQCAKNVLENVEPGSIVVFHDSEKAFKNLEFALPLVLKTLEKDGYKFWKIAMEGR